MITKWIFKEFLSEALNQKLKVKGREGNVFFELNPEVTSNYNNNSFFDFLEIYCEKENHERFALNQEVPEEYMDTIFYYAFLNNYLVAEDDFLGVDFIRNTSSFIETLHKYDYTE